MYFLKFYAKIYKINEKGGDIMTENDIFDELKEPAGTELPEAYEQDELDQLSLQIPGEEDEGDSALPEGKADEETDVSDPTVYNSEKPRKIDARFEFIELMILTLVAVFVLTSFFFRHSIVDGDSMMNTLQNGDCLITTNLFYTPKQYDIVVIEDHSVGIYHPLVKRVIAVGGDEVKVTKNEIYVNGELVRDDFVYIDSETYKYTPATFTVPEGRIYVLGDHRSDSTDSEDFGTVSVDSIIGKVLFRFYPFSEFGSVYTKGE